MVSTTTAYERGLICRARGLPTILQGSLEREAIQRISSSLEEGIPEQHYLRPRGLKELHISLNLQAHMSAATTYRHVGRLTVLSSHNQMREMDSS
jgi:hypothetical protein